MNDKLKKAKEQWDRPIPEFKQQVKCCYNCRNWFKDITLMGEYAYNDCLCKKNTMTRWDSCCDQYSGVAREENLIYCLTKEEKKEISNEQD